MPTNSKHPETLVLHSGQYRSDGATNSVAVPIYQTTSYQFSSTENASNLSVSYTHLTLPTTPYV